MSSNRKYIIDLINQQVIPSDKIKEALTLIYPKRGDWKVFLDNLLLWLGGLSLGVATIFFIAYNWKDIGYFAKFGMLELLLIGAIFVYYKFADHKLIGKVSLVLATLFLGATMALFGQTYQTGADPWQLFFNWSLLMLPWAYISKFPAMWIIWVVLINLTIVLYNQVFGGTFGAFFNSDELTMWLIFCFNSLVLVVWEILSKYRPWLDVRWSVRLLALASGVTLTSLTLNAIFKDNTDLMIAAVVWFSWMGANFYLYQKVKADLFMLTGGCISGIIVISSFVFNSFTKIDVGELFIMSLLVIILGTISSLWLKRLNMGIKS